MDVEFDLSKSRRNEVLRGIFFELAREFDFITALTKNIGYTCWCSRCVHQAFEYQFAKGE